MRKSSPSRAEQPNKTDGTPKLMPTGHRMAISKAQRLMWNIRWKNGYKDAKGIWHEPKPHKLGAVKTPTAKPTPAKAPTSKQSLDAMTARINKLRAELAKMRAEHKALGEMIDKHEGQIDAETAKIKAGFQQFIESLES